MVALLPLCSFGCSRSPDQQEVPDVDSESGLATVYVVNYPLKYFAERVGGDRVSVEFPAPPDIDPAFWKPTAEDIIGFQQADLILLNGAHYAHWVATVSLPQSKTVNTSTSISEQLIQLEEATTHSHGPEGQHAHGGMAFTTWLDPKLAIEQARAVCDALNARWPEHEQQFESGFADLERDLRELDAAIEGALADTKDTPLVFSHPVYQYFQRRYGLNGKSVHWEPDEAPSAEQWDELAEILKSHRAEWMIWEGQPSQDTVSRLREMGIESVVFDPCGNVPEDGDYLAVMQKNLSGMADAFSLEDPDAGRPANAD
jgi:zinc transport system substrate-binding protein